MPATRKWMCNNGSTYSEDGKFASNLNRVLEDLVNKTSYARFNTSLYGQGPYKVYGLLECRGDTSPDECWSCSQEASTSIKGHCPNGIGGRVSLEMNAILTLLSNLAVKASEPANKRFATGKGAYSSLARVATDNFNKDNKLGEGGFGPVYKGRISDGTEVAVKMLSVRSMQGKREFMNEVKLVAKIQHRNLVRILGCCSDGPEKLLVYEYLPNKSLDTFLFDPEKSKLLDWKKRYNIIIGIVRGLLYLHQDSQLRIIHRDIKASNILLDDNLNPKIADFGLAKIFPEGETHISTRVVGTQLVVLCSSYMAPEYVMQGQLSEKADVYSFGLLLLEIVSGRKNTDFDLLPEMQVLLGWAWGLYNEGRIADVVDQTILMAATRPDQEQALRCLQIGLLCAQADAAIRPQMHDVIMMLNSCEGLADPKMPAFLTYVNHNQNSTCSSGRQKLQRVDWLSHTILRSSSALPHCDSVPYKNDISISELQPR
eukprot:Gb_31433 [translate_table: standard]